MLCKELFNCMAFFLFENYHPEFLRVQRTYSRHQRTYFSIFFISIKILTMYILLYILTKKKGDDFMQATIQKWGNSQGIRIPKAFLEALGMMENDLVELSRVDDHIVIKKAKKESKLTLEQIFKDYEGESTAEEFDWGAPVGKEVW